MIELDKWAAEQCDIDIEHSLLWKIPDRGDGLPRYFHYEWTLSDPRCMQVFREKFGLATFQYSDGTWQCEDHGAGMRGLSSTPIGSGKTIQEAELACAEKIMEEHNG